MAIMTRMRDNMPVILIGLVVVFIITIVFEWGMDYLGLSRTNDTVGIIDGKKISYQEFSELVRQQTEHRRERGRQRRQCRVVEADVARHVILDLRAVLRADAGLRRRVPQQADVPSPRAVVAFDHDAQ